MIALRVVIQPPIHGDDELDSDDRAWAFCEDLYEHLIKLKGHHTEDLVPNDVSDLKQGYDDVQSALIYMLQRLRNYDGYEIRRVSISYPNIINIGVCAIRIEHHLIADKLIKSD